MSYRIMLVTKDECDVTERHFLLVVKTQHRTWLRICLICQTVAVSW